MAVVIKKTVQAAKPVVKSVAKVNDGYQVVSMDSIEFLSTGRGGGKPMDPATQKLIDKALTLQIGQGIKIPANLRVERAITNSKTGVTATLYTYKGAQSLGKKAKDAGLRFRTRRDVTGNLWLFAAEPLPEKETA